MNSRGKLPEKKKNFQSIPRKEKKRIVEIETEEEKRIFWVAWNNYKQHCRQVQWCGTSWSNKQNTEIRMYKFTFFWHHFSIGRRYFNPRCRKSLTRKFCLWWKSIETQCPMKSRLLFKEGRNRTYGCDRERRKDICLQRWWPTNTLILFLSESKVWWNNMPLL